MRIWVNGCFDILHIGHMRLLEYAKSLGDTLTVGIDTDSRVKLLKGDKRPINNQNIRKEMLMGIKWVNNVLIFDSAQELDSLIAKSADKIVVGSEYIDKDVIGSSHCEVDFFLKIGDFSTTRILQHEIRK